MVRLILVMNVRPDVSSVCSGAQRSVPWNTTTSPRLGTRTS